MARTKGSYSLSANIEINAAAPLDARERVATLADLTAEGSFPYHYVGMETYVVATGKKYRLTGSDPTVSANWSEIGEGGSGTGGHTIEDSIGTDMSSRSNLQFKGAASVSDDSENDRTVVEVPIMPSSDMSEILNPPPQPNPAPDLSDLGDVNISSASNGQVLKYNSSTSKWENTTDSGGAEDLDDLSDVDIASASNGQVLKYNSSTSKWENANEDAGISDLDDLSDVNINSATDGQVLKWDDTTSKWINADEDGVSSLEDLTDVDITSVTDGQSLKWDATNSKWVNDTVSGGHTIENASGTDLTARSNLQFKGAATATDDSTNDRTVVDVPIMPPSDMSEILTPLPGPNLVPDLEDLGDVNIQTLTDGQILKWDATNSEWINDDESGGGSAGHTIENSIGTDMTARANLQFKGVAVVSDDSTNDRTVVDVPVMPSSDMSEIVTPLPGPSSPTYNDEYSTTETRIGTWIDGKDLYRRVFSFPGAANVAANTWTSVLSVSLSNLDNIIRSTVISNDSDKPAELNYVTAMYFKNDGAFKVLHTRSVALNFVDPTYIICEYTKTSS